MKALWLSILWGCTSKTVDTGPSGEDTSSPVDTSPSPPDPFTLVVSGSTNLNLMFDTPTCQIPSAAPNFNAFWRTSTGAHVFVLRVMVLGSYNGAGVYNTSVEDSRALSVTLQEEAGGEARYFYVDTAQGQSASLELNVFSESVDTGEPNEVVFGQLNASNLSSTDGTIQIDPTTIPIWCDEDNTAG